MGLAGTVVSAISFVTCWLWPAGASHTKTVDEAAPEALSYFVISSVIIAAAIVTYDIFFRQPFVKQHLQPEGEPSSNAGPCLHTPVVQYDAPMESCVRKPVPHTSESTFRRRQG